MGVRRVMLSYQAHHTTNTLYLRGALGLRPAPEFDASAAQWGITAGTTPERIPAALSPALIGLD